MTELERLRAERNAAIADRDHLKDRERSIIEACERVADGGQYRADIVSAIQTIRRQRDERGNLLRRIVALCDERDAQEDARALYDIIGQIRTEASK